MRLTLAALLIASPAAAWEFTPGPICTLSHATETAEIVLTHDPARPLFTLEVTLKQGTWADSDWFAMRFDGPAGRMISTNRHRLSPDRRTLGVADTGFGNVLDGLQFSNIASAFTDSATAAFALKGAEGPTKAFRACRAAPTS